MIKNTISCSALAVIFGLAIVVTSCNKNSEEANKNPTCVITNPLSAEEIIQGKIVTISVEAMDTDGSIREVQFFIDGIGMGSAQNSPYNYEWHTSTETVAEHTIRAKAIDNDGGEKSSEIVIEIIKSTGIPLSNFSAESTSGSAPLTIQFIDLSTNNPTSWLWNFGDGYTNVSQNPLHTYIEEGIHTVSLTATNSNGTDTETKVDFITVESTGENPPVSNFSADPTGGIKPLTIQFSDQSTNNPTSWLWNFGDGNTSASQNPSHTYNAVGTYVVSLSVANSYGTDIETKLHFIAVSDVSTFIDPRDNQTYNTVVLGNQEEWFAQNLNFETNNSSCYDNNGNYCDELGRLYTWEAASTACPPGWHLPTDDEWKRLEMYLGMSQEDADLWGGDRGTDEGEKLKTTGWGGTDEVRFSALPGGMYHPYYGNYYGYFIEGFWWSATPHSSGVWCRYLYSNSDQIDRDNYTENYKFSVRCVKD